MSTSTTLILPFHFDFIQSYINYYLPVQSQYWNHKERCNLFKVNNETVKTPERRQWGRSGIFIVNFEQIALIAQQINRDSLSRDGLEMGSRILPFSYCVFFFFFFFKSIVLFHYTFSCKNKLIFKIYTFLTICRNNVCANVNHQFERDYVIWEDNAVNL